MALPSTEPNVLGETSLSEFDVIVIGSGAGGSAATYVLCNEGLRVLVLEAGDNYFPGLDDPGGQPPPLFSNDELKLGVRHLIETDAVVDPRSFRASEADGMRTFVGDVNGLPKTVGGAAVHADMKYVRFNDFDFQLGTLLGDIPGASFADWPVSYDALEPFYVEVEHAVGVQGLDGSDPNASMRSRAYPMPPGIPMYANQLLADAASELGYTPFPYPTAVNSVPYRGRPACVDCGFCSGYGCVNHSKCSPAVTLLRAALLTGNCQVRFNAPAMRLVPNATGTAVDSIEYLDPAGDMQEARADRIVLAASPVEDARLLLLSDPDGSGLGNSSDQVGRNLLFHFQTIVAGVMRQRVHGHRGRSVTHGFSDFRGVPGDPMRPLGGIVELSARAEVIAEAKTYAFDLGQRGRRLVSLMRESPLRDKIVALIMQAEDAPQATNRVDLDPEIRDLNGRPVARVTYASHDYELSAREHYLPKMVEILQGAGAQFGLVDPIDVPSSSRHVMGTLRMGSDPATSVCDATGKLHDLGNVYCADGALFPTSSGMNPTLTLQALAMRVAGDMVYPGTPERVLRE